MPHPGAELAPDNRVVGSFSRPHRVADATPFDLAPDDARAEPSANAGTVEHAGADFGLAHPSALLRSADPDAIDRVAPPVRQVRANYVRPVVGLCLAGRSVRSKDRGAHHQPNLSNASPFGCADATPHQPIAVEGTNRCAHAAPDDCALNDANRIAVIAQPIICSDVAPPFRSPVALPIAATVGVSDYTAAHD